MPRVNSTHSLVIPARPEVSFEAIPTEQKKSAVIIGGDVARDLEPVDGFHRFSAIGHLDPATAIPCPNASAAEVQAPAGNEPPPLADRAPKCRPRPERRRDRIASIQPRGAPGEFARHLLLRSRTCGERLAAALSVAPCRQRYWQRIFGRQSPSPARAKIKRLAMRSRALIDSARGMARIVSSHALS